MGDPGSIPGSGRSPGEGIGYPLHYYWASLVAQLVKNQPAGWETWVRSLGWEEAIQSGDEHIPHTWSLSQVMTNSRKTPMGFYLAFPGGSDGKASAYNAGDLGSIPG